MKTLKLFSGLLRDARSALQLYFKMHSSTLGNIRFSPVLVFSVGWCVVMLSLVAGVGIPWNTFMIGWKVELIASLFLIGVLIYFLRNSETLSSVSRDEARLLLIPIALFILWSGVSISYAASWKPAVHHTLVWTEYLIFYIALRHFLTRSGAYPTLLSVPLIALVAVFFPAISAYIGLLFFGGDNHVGIKFARYGELIVTLLPLVLVGVIRAPGRQFVLGIGVTVSLWLIVFCSAGRINNFLFAGIIAVAVTSAFLFKRFHRYRGRVLILSACLLIAPALVQTFALFSNDQKIPFLARLEDQESLNNSNNFRKLMITLSAEMITDNPILGVGADNFGYSVNSYRAAYGERVPDDPNLAIAESEIPERTHNEFLQIAAELGFVGAAIMLWFLIGVAVLSIKLLASRPRSPYPYAAVLGIAAFLTSSLVSSYSFRMMQDGMVFFFVLAVAVKLLKPKRATRSREVVNIPARLVTASCVAGILACVSLAAYSAVRAASVALTIRADYTYSIEDAVRNYEMAMRLDDSNPEPHSSLGLRMISEKRYPEAVAPLAESIRLGKATSYEISYMVTAQRLAGDLEGAEQTLAAAIKLYPRSTFVLTRYAELLQTNGKREESELVRSRALGINRRTTNTWWTFMNQGSRAASEMAFKNEDYVHVMDLWPTPAIYALKAERDILYPDERVQFGFGQNKK